MSSKPLDLSKIREGDALMREARRLDPDVRLPSPDELQRILSMPKPTEKRTGRPPGAEPTVTIALRIPRSLCDQLDARVASLEAETGMRAGRTAICRRALQLYLQEEPSAPAKATTAKRARTPARAAKG